MPAALWPRSGDRQTSPGNRTIAGARAYFFEAGTTTPLTVYEDDDLTVPHEHPVIADGHGGWPPVYFAPGLYRLRILDGDGAALLDFDGIVAPGPFGNMDSTVYDPTGVQADAFNRNNHTGTQPLSSISNAGSAAALDVGTTAGTVAAGDHLHGGVYEPVDGDILRADTTDQLTAGFTAAPANNGTRSSGTFTPSAAAGNLQYYTNGGAHTLAAPSADCTMLILVTNNSSAGAITFSGFTVSSNDGGPLTTTNNHRFLIQIARINGVSTYHIKKLQ